MDPSPANLLLSDLQAYYVAKNLTNKELVDKWLGVFDSNCYEAMVTWPGPPPFSLSGR